MSRYQFPIAEVNDNQLISISGDKSYFYNLKGVDLEQLSDLEKDNFFTGLKERLNNLDHDSWFKFYRLKDDLYLNTSSEEQQLGLETSKSEYPLEIFFENRDIYSDIGIYDDYLLFNGKYRRIISVKSFSDKHIDEYFMPSGIDYCLSFKKKSNTKALKDLERIRNAHSAGLAKNKRDFESEGVFKSKV